MNRQPSKAELWSVIEQVETKLLEMIGRAHDGIPSEIRNELSDPWQLLNDTLKRAGRRR